jgi:hypothetical protein
LGEIIKNPQSEAGSLTWVKNPWGVIPHTLMLPLLFHDAALHKIISLLTYHPQDQTASVLSTPTRRDPLTHAMNHHHPPCATLGDLDALLIELLNAILCYSDLHTVSVLRLLNRRTQHQENSNCLYLSLYVLFSKIKTEKTNSEQGPPFFVFFCLSLDNKT